MSDDDLWNNQRVAIGTAALIALGDNHIG